MSVQWIPNLREKCKIRSAAAKAARLSRSLCRGECHSLQRFSSAHTASIAKPKEALATRKKGAARRC